MRCNNGFTGVDPPMGSVPTPASDPSLLTGLLSLARHSTASP